MSSTPTPPLPFPDPTIFAQTFLAPMMVFVFGSVLGFICAYFLQSEVLEVRETIALVITASWVVSLMADIAFEHYQTTIYVHGMMGGVVGYLFGVESFPFIHNSTQALRTTASHDDGIDTETGHDDHDMTGDNKR